MKIVEVMIENFRGIASSDISLSGHTVFVGDNNTGKSTVLEAIELVLGPDRLSKRPVVDEHDFYAGKYLDEEGEPVEIRIELIITDLNDDQQVRFKDHLEWWDKATCKLLDGPPLEETDRDDVKPALRVRFSGAYDKEEDDFIGRTNFLNPVLENGQLDTFRVNDKRECGFLFLRTLRTGSRALSLERGSLLDVILKLEERRLKMWEEVLGQLRDLPVADDPALGISEILTSVQEAVRLFVPSEWANSPHLRVSDLTRESLRKILTVFMGTGAKRQDGSEYAAPFQHQGTGTINTLVLALLSRIAELKQNVIFAMEEPEIAIPPHTQRQIINSIRGMSSQALFTSHSPYVLDEFDPSEVQVLTREEGVLTGIPAGYPPSIKPKSYRAELRTRFCEALLARRVLITEGRTEYDAWPTAARRLADLHPNQFRSLENLGIAVVDAATDSQVAPLGAYYKNLGKVVLAVFDKQSPAKKLEIEAVVHYAFEAPENGFEDVILKGTSEAALRRFGLALVAGGDWPFHLSPQTPNSTMLLATLKVALDDYFKWSKGAGTAADLLFECSRDEMPSFIVETLEAINRIVEPSLVPESSGSSEDLDV